MVFPAPAQSIANTNVNAVGTTTLLQRLAKHIPLSTLWIEEQNVQARRVARYRRYYDGDHDLKLTDEMKDLLRIQDIDDGFAINFMPTVVDTKADRCIVQTMEGVEADAGDAPTEKAPDGAAKSTTNPITTWAQGVMDDNNFDVIQGDEHEQTIRDGNGYLLVEWDNDKKRNCFYVEPAWDGQTGVLMVYRSHNVTKPYAAIKIWQIEGATAEDNLSISVTTRCNIYYEDRVEKFVAFDLGEFQPFNDEGNYKQKWDMVDGKPIGLPIVHFRNAGRENYGVSELRNAIAPQNALNRFNYSAVMAAELTAFPIYVELGFTRSTTAVAPGMVVNIPGPVPRDQVVDFKKIEGSDIGPILEMIDSQRRLLSEITRTPSPDLAAGSGSNKSGEYLKQLEVGLIGKVRRFTTRAGSSWEQVFDLAWRIQQAYGSVKPPPYKRFVCKWQTPEIRNNAEIVQNAMLAADVMGEKQTLRNMTGAFEGLTEDRIEDIVAEKHAAAGQRMSALAGNLPTFNNFAEPRTSNPIPKAAA